MAEFIARPAEHVDTRLRIELRGDEYIVFGKAVEGENGVTEYRTDDRDIAEALRQNPLLEVETVVDESEATATDVRSLKADVVNAHTVGDEYVDGDDIREALAAAGRLEDQQDDADEAPAPVAEPAPVQPPTTTQPPSPTSWDDDGGKN